MNRIIQLMIYLSFASLIESSYANPQQKKFEGEWCCHTCKTLEFRNSFTPGWRSFDRLSFWGDERRKQD